MLHRSTHNRFAFEHNPERERRLLWNAEEDEGLEGNAEQANKSLGEANPRNPVEAITQETRTEVLPSIENVAQIEKAASSPPLLLAAIDTDLLISKEEREAFRQKFVTLGEAPTESALNSHIVGYLREHPDELKPYQERLATRLLHNPEDLLQITKHVETRLQRYRELSPRRFSSAMKKVDFAFLNKKVQSFEEQGRTQQDLIRSVVGENADGSAALQKISAELGLDLDQPPPEEQTAAFGTTFIAPLFGRLRSWQKWMNMQATDREADNKQFTDRSVDTLKELRKTVQALKGYLDTQLRERAHALDQKLSQRRLERQGGKRTAREPSQEELQELGMTRTEYLYTIGESGAFLEAAQRMKDAVKKDSLGAPPTIASRSYLTYARNTLRRLQEMEQQEDADPARGFEWADLERKKTEHEQAKLWAKQTARRLERLRAQTPKEQWKQAATTLQALANESTTGIDDPRLAFLKNNPDLSNLEAQMGFHATQLQPFTAEGNVPETSLQLLWDEYDPRRQKSLDFICNVVENPDRFTLPAKPTAEVLLGIPQRVESARGKLTQISEKLLPGGALSTELDHDVCLVLNIRSELESAFQGASAMLTNAEESADAEGGQRALMDLESAEALIEKFEACNTQLTQLHSTTGVVTDHQFHAAALVTDEEFQRRALRSGRGFYDPKTGQIIINRDKTQKATPQETEAARRAVYEHERGHAIVWILTESSKVFPNILDRFHDSIATDIPEDQPVSPTGEKRTVDQLLESLAEEWGIPSLETYKDRMLGRIQSAWDLEQAASDERRKHLADELLNKYASWLGKSDEERQRAKPEARALFQYLRNRFGDNGDIRNRKRLAEHVQGMESPDALLRFETGEGEATESDETSSGKPPASGPESSDIYQDLRDFRTKVEKVKHFCESYPEYKGQLDGMYERYIALIKQIEESLRKKSKSEPAIRASMTKANASVEDLLKELDQIRSEKFENMTSEGGQLFAKGWRTIFDHVDFLSVKDLINVGKSAGEDIARMWKRRGESAQARFGYGITSWIADGVPYLGRLKSEFQKRGHASDLEEVNHIKEALKDADAWELQNHLHTQRNADFIRAVLELLTEKGRLDWNDEEFWHTLNALSQYKMPIKACKHDGVLRDRWLQKIITDIWGDKDHYFNWRQANDSGFDSGKKKFTPTADQLSHVSDGLKNGLRNMLKKWCEATNDGREIRDVPEDINPQLYEEILHYAIRNGKMAMEDKMFYLVQGVRYRLLSIDRLAVLGGQGGEILNRFPFIDYFDRHNNTTPEIERISNRIQDPDNKFLPSSRTTVWFNLEVLRDKAVQDRIAKGTSRTNAEGLDHEDVPAIMSSADYALVTELTGVISGDRYKLSPPGMKNAYAGFATRFKALARVAQLHTNGEAQFTVKDTDELAKSLLAFSHYDNIITNNASDGTRRAKLSWDQIKSTGPSTQPLTAEVVRDENKKLVMEIFGEVMTDADWASIGIEKNEYFRTMINKEVMTTSTSTEKDRAAKIFDATAKIAQMLPKLMQQKRDRVATILSARANSINEERKENATTDEKDQWIKLQTVRDYYQLAS